MKYSDIQIGDVVVLGKFNTQENAAISNTVATVVSKCCGDCGGHIKVRVDGIVSPIYEGGTYTVHLCNIKSVVALD